MGMNLLTTQQMRILLLITEDDDSLLQTALEQSSVKWVHLNLIKKEGINMMVRPKCHGRLIFVSDIVLAFFLHPTFFYNVCMDQRLRTQTGPADARLPVADARLGVIPLYYFTN